MNLISIQGKYAPGFYFKGDELFACESLMKSLANDDFLVISSRFRSDILYLREHERNTSVVRIWCLYKRKEYNSTLLNRFYRSTDTTESLSEFFVRLLYLRRVPAWYNPYIHVLENRLNNTSNVIAQCLKECYDLMIDRNIFSAAEVQEQEVPPEPLRFRDSRSIVQEMLNKYQLN